jgi:hypothetical protein
MKQSTRFIGMDMGKGKLKPVVVTAMARELAGFVWSIACVTSDPHRLRGT